VLFLFVVMMLDVDFSQLRQGSPRYMPIGLVVAAILAAEMILVSTLVAAAGRPRGRSGRRRRRIPASPNAEAIGRVLYTDYVYFFRRPAWCCWWR